MTQGIISYSNFDANLQGSIELPASKSISNRALIIKALCAEDFDLDNLSSATDTKVMRQILDDFRDTSALQVFDVRDAGTCFRFLTAYFAIKENVEIVLKGTDRMHLRPIAPLVEALNKLGADITYLEKEGFPPLRIKGKALQGGHVELKGDISSQYISALCLIAPALKNGLTMTIQGNIVSYPYIEMTLKMMSHFGFQSVLESGTIILKPQPYLSSDYWVESDWSSACFFYAMAMVGDRVCIQCKGRYFESLQGDSYIRIFAQDFGIKTSFEGGFIQIEKFEMQHLGTNPIYDLGAYPDLAIPVIVACAIKFPNVKFTGLEHLKYKESDRVHALQFELQKVHIRLIHKNGFLSIDNTNYNSSPKEILFDTHNDHRIAMALAIFALEGFSVVLNNVNCIQKSFPNYFQQLSKLGFKVIIS